MVLPNLRSFSSDIVQPLIKKLLDVVCFEKNRMDRAIAIAQRGYQTPKPLLKSE